MFSPIPSAHPVRTTIRRSLLSLFCVISFSGAANLEAKKSSVEENVLHLNAQSSLTIPLDQLEAKSSQASKDSVNRKDREIQVSLPSSEGVVTLESPFLEVSAEREYEARVILEIREAAPETRIKITVREYEDRDTKPPTRPAPATEPADERVQLHQKGIRTIRSLAFTSSKTSKFVKCSVSVIGGPAQVSLLELKLVDLERAKTMDHAEFRSRLEKMQEKARARRPILPRSLAFVRSQIKYGLDRNYYRQWIDRPLRVDRSIRENAKPSEPLTPIASYIQMMRDVHDYGLDGFAFFPELRMPVFEMTDRNRPNEEVMLLPEFLGNKNITEKVAAVQAALKSTSAVRIGDKVLFTSYVAQALTPAEWKEVLDAIRQTCGDRFLFLPALHFPVKFIGDFQKGIPIEEAEIEEAKQFLRSYLEVSDGIYFHYPVGMRKDDHTFDHEFYRDFFIPLFKSVLAEPEYANKYLGLAVGKSHHHNGLHVGLLEDGTRTLRNCLQTVLDAKPDVIVLPEWDEFNENTGWMPTVCNSLAPMRITRHLLARTRGKQEQPLKGDRTDLPNLILSYRKILTLGERLDIELLNVPDGTPSSKFEAQVSLQDPSGKTIKSFPPVSCTTNEFSEHRFAIPTEDLKDFPAVVPVLTFKGYQGKSLENIEGFLPIQIRATWNWNYKGVMQPLRDLIFPERARLAFEEEPGPGARQVHLVCDFACDEDLALVEVVEDDQVVYAFSEDDLRATNEETRLLIEYRSTREQKLTGTITIKNATPKWTLNRAKWDVHTPAGTVQDNVLTLDTPVSVHLRYAHVIFPTAQANNAVIDIDCNLLKIQVPVSHILREGVYSIVGENGFNLTISDFAKQLDMPLHADKPEVLFRLLAKPDINTAQYHLRVTTKSGKTYRSRPLLIPDRLLGTEEFLTVYSDTKHSPVELLVLESRIPKIYYELSDRSGAVLKTSAGRPFYGTLGGFSDSATGTGGGESGYGGQILYYLKGRYPSSASVTDPQLVKEDGEPALKFDGKGTFLLLPNEAIPRRAPFTLTFEIKPQTAQKPQVLFIHQAGGLSSLLLEIRDGKLAGTFRSADKTIKLDTEIPLSPGKWTPITVVNDLQNITISAGEAKAVFPCKSHGSDIGMSAFGGFGSKEGDTEGNPGWYEGFIRNISVLHTSH